MLFEQLVAEGKLEGPDGTKIVPKTRSEFYAQWTTVAEPALSMVILLCVIMSFVLTLFFGWHFYLVLANTTTNDSVKKNEIILEINKMLKILMPLIEEANKFREKSDKPAEGMPRLRIDGVEMPRDPEERLEKFGEYVKKFEKR